jgi:endonuclease III
MAKRAASVKSEAVSPPKRATRSARSSASSAIKQEDGITAETSPRKRVKKEEDQDDDEDVKTTSKSRKPKMTTSERKLNSLRTSLETGPFPDWHKPSPEEALEVAEILTKAHGYKSMPVKQPPRGDDRWGGCGDVASVLDATVRTILSCNTNGANSRNAHRSMCETFGKNNWQAILDAKHSEVADSIRCGGLHEAKAKTIQGVLRDTMERHGKLSLDHLHQAESRQVMEELISFNGVGPKVASCVSAFCIGKEEMAVDTHVHRLCKKLGWVPEKASRDQTYYHLFERIPGHLKYPLHVLLIKHGKACSDCSARGFATDRYQSPAWKEEGMSVISGVKPEDIDEIKEEEGQFEKVNCPLRAAGLFAKGSKGKKAKAPKMEIQEFELVPKQEVQTNGIKQEE